MSESYTFNTAAASLTTLADLKAMLASMRRLAPPAMTPIIAIQITPEKFHEATHAAGFRGWTDPSPRLCGFPLDSMDVVPELGWIYIGTPGQLADTRKRFGSLTKARAACEQLEAHLKKEANR